MKRLERKTQQWLLVIDLRSRGLTFAQIAALTGVSRQRAHQIVGRARIYASKHNDGLAQAIKEMAALLAGEGGLARYPRAGE